jgi:hypothetical protein
MKKILFVVSLCSICTSLLFSQAFVDKGYHPRLTALGRSAAALTDNAGTLFYNPATIGFSSTARVYAGYTNLYPNVSDDNFNVVNAAGEYAIENFGVAGIGVSQFAPNFWTERTIIATVASRLLNEDFSVGASVKMLGWNAASPQGELAVPEPSLSLTSFTFDAGIVYRIPEILDENDLQVGFAVLNITQPSIAHNGSADAALPMELSSGFAYLSHKYHYTILGGIFYKKQDIKLTFGFEATALQVTVAGMQSAFIVRFGGGRVTTPNSQGEYNGGFGIVIDNLSIDYAYTYQAFIREVGGISSVALSYEF